LDAVTKEVKDAAKLKKGRSGVSAHSFSFDKKYYACSDMHNDHNISLGQV